MFSLNITCVLYAVVSNLSKNFTPNLTFNACRCPGSDPCDPLSLHLYFSSFPFRIVCVGVAKVYQFLITTKSF